MRDCPNGEIRDVLPEFVHGRLEAAAAARVQAHLTECDDCAAEVAALRSWQEELSAPVPVDLAAITAGVLARTTAAKVAAPTRGGFGSARWLRAAALVLSVGGGSWLVVQQTLRPGGGPGQPAPSGPVVAAVPEGTTTGLGFAGGVSDLGDTELQELEAAVAALEQEPIADVETTEGDWGTTTGSEGR